jgi:hypothetical protein
MYAGQVPLGRRPGRIGFMSTQRREGRSTLATLTCRRGPRNRCRRIVCTNRAGALEAIDSAPVTRHNRALAGEQAFRPIGPPRSLPSDENPSPRASATLAKYSLQKDHRIVRIVPQDFRRNDQALKVGSCMRAGKPAAFRSSPSPISILSGSALLHSTLPKAPAGDCRRAERYDGKRDLHFQHAA